MHKDLQAVVTALDELGHRLLDQNPSDVTFVEQHSSWDQPPLSIFDLTSIIAETVAKIQRANIKDIDENTQIIIQEIPGRIKLFKDYTVDQMLNSNHNHAIFIFFGLMQWIHSCIDSLFEWDTLHNPNMVPKALKRKIESIDAQLNELIPNKELLEGQISTIKNAYDAAESLPINLKDLREAKAKMETLMTDSSTLNGKIEEFFRLSESNDAYITIRKKQIDDLLANCEDAYKSTATKGLAASFDKRGKSLTTSMYIWVVGLLGALTAGAIIGSKRFDAVHDAIENKHEPAFIWIQIFLSIISFGAPIWLAWISTKQISQRFKLAEDYAFKASVAKAYQGYKREAIEVDEKFAGRLFGSALERLEEAPLRLMEEKHYSSPWMELLGSKDVQKAIDSVPEAKSQLIEFLKNTTERALELKTKKKVAKQTPTIDNKEE